MKVNCEMKLSKTLLFFLFSFLFVSINRVEGVAGYYKGIVPNLIRVVPQTGITFVVYEHLHRFLIDYNDAKTVT